jgi:hypothetical protein
MDDDEDIAHLLADQGLYGLERSSMNGGGSPTVN